MNYKRIYFEIILNRVNNPLQEDVYGQKHHVLPKSLYPQYAKTKANIVKLTYREHYICHWLLTKIKPCRQMINAFWRMNCCKKDLYFNSYAYSKIRQNFIDLKKGSHLSQDTKEKMSKSLKGRKFTKEHCLKISEANKKRIVSNDTKQKISAANTGRKHSEQSKEKISKAGKGRVVSEETREKISISNKGKNTGKTGYWKGKTIPEEIKRKISEKKKGSTAWNKGLKNCYTLSEETKQKLRDKMKNKRWINNGDKQIYIEVNSELPEGYVFGRLKKNKIK